MRHSALLVAFVVALSCSPDGTRTTAPSPAPRTPEAARLVLDPGKVVCHYGTGDVRSEGSGDASGPRPLPPRPSQPGSDLTRVVASRYRAGMTVVFGSNRAVPASVPFGARLQYSLTATTRSGGFGAISAILLHDEWMVEVRDGDRYTVLPGRPAIAGRVLQVLVDAERIPEAMRGRFRWHASSEWAPPPRRHVSTVFSDFCPDGGFPRFGGAST